MENNIRNFGKFSPEQLYVGTQNWDFYEAENRKVEKCKSLKFTRDLCVMTMKKDSRFKKELTSSNLPSGIQQVLTRALENLKNLHFNVLLLTKVYNASA